MTEKKAQIKFSTKIISFIIVTLYGMYYYFNRGNISNLKDFLIEDMHLTASGFSEISSAFSITYGLSQPLGGYAMDKIGIKLLCPILLLIGSSSLYIFAGATSPTIAIYCRYVLGIAFCVASTGSYKYLSMVWDKHFAILSNIIPIVMALAASFSASGTIKALMISMGWKNFIRGVAFFGFILAILLYFALSAVSESEEKPVVEGNFQEMETSLVEGIKVVTTTPGFLPVTIFSVTISAAAYTIMDGWGNTLLSLKFPALAEAYSSAPATMNMAGNACGFLYNIWASNKLSIKQQMYVFGLLSLGALSSLIYLDLSCNSLLLCFAILGFSCAGQSIGFLWMQKTLRRKYLGLGFGILNFSCMYFGCALVQKFAGALLDMLKNTAVKNGIPLYEGYRYVDLLQMFQFLLIPSIISLVIIFFVRNKKNN